MIDVESDGPIPGVYSMLSFAVVVIEEDGTIGESFRVELAPMTDKFDPEALAATGIDRDYHIKHGRDPREAMSEFHAWVRAQVADGATPVICGRPLKFDGMWQHWYAMYFLGEDPCGFDGLDLRSLAMGRLRRGWHEVGFTWLKKHFGVTLPHSHDPLDDAKEQAEVLAGILKA